MEDTKTFDQETPAYLTIAEIKAANARHGHYFFEKGTLRFFNSKIYSAVYGGRWFVTGERMELDMPLLYTIRAANVDGSIDTVGDFQAFDTYAAAVAACERLEAGEGLISNEDAYAEAALDNWDRNRT